MTLQQLITKWQGKYVEVAGSSNALNQCVDLANLYIRDVLGLPIIEWTNAVDFPSKAGDKYEYILNTPTNIPKEGDIIVWKPSPGHIAVFIEGNVDTFRSFDQNFPIGSPCHIQNHTYLNVIGWLQSKISSTTEGSVAVENKVFENLVRKGTIYDKVIVKLNVEDSETVVLGEIDKNIAYEDAVAQKDRQLTEAQAKISQLEKDAATAEESREKMRIELAVVKQENQEQAKIIEKKEKRIDELGVEYTRISGALHDLQEAIKNPKQKFAKIWEGIRELVHWR